MSIELDEYKARVKQVALDAKREHGWCTEIDNMLRELDIEVTSKYLVRVTVTTELRVDADNEEQADDIAREWVTGVAGDAYNGDVHQIEEAADIEVENVELDDDQSE